MASDANLPQCAAVDGCDSYGHPLRCESVATSQQAGLCDRHALRNKPLPIPTYGLDWRANDGLAQEPDGDWCKAADVRGLVERMRRAEAQRDLLTAALHEILDLADLRYAAHVAEKALAAIDQEPTP